jgi:hypothetical protein
MFRSSILAFLFTRANLPYKNQLLIVDYFSKQLINQKQTAKGGLINRNQPSAAHPVERLAVLALYYNKAGDIRAFRTSHSRSVVPMNELVGSETAVHVVHIIECVSFLDVTLANTRLRYA